MLKSALLAAVVLSAANTAVHAQSVFSDNFSTSTGATFDTTGVIGSGDPTPVWSIERSATGDFGAKIDGGLMTVTNDASGATQANGWAFAYTNTANFSAPYSTTLDENATAVTWSFNMQQIRPAPAGLASGSYGVAFVLGASSTTAATAGNGYAVVLGNSGDPDPIRLVSFTNGLRGTLTNIISASSPLDDVGANYLSLGVTYDPIGDTWSLFGRDDGASAFASPASGLTSLGASVANSTHTGVSLNYLGGFWSGANGVNQFAQFDNVSVGLVPVPEVGALFGALGLLAPLAYRERRHWMRCREARV